MLKSLGPMELGIILLIVVMIFGVGKLPQIGSAIGKSIRAFKSSQADDDEEEEETPKPKKRRVVKKKTTAGTPVDDKTQSA
jgi:sec-independent protein translocase protein TatA